MDFTPIPKFPGYGVSKLGEIKNLTKGNILKPMYLRLGYTYVNLKVDGVYKNVTIHRIVSEVFLGESTLDVNHKNGIKWDNRIDNLEYCTKSENTRHRFDVLGQEGLKGSKNKYSKKVICTSKEGIKEIFESAGEASRSKMIKKCNVILTCLGKQKTAGGYFFTYA